MRTDNYTRIVVDNRHHELIDDGCEMCEHLFEALECRVDDVTELGGYCGGVAGYNEAQSEEDVGELAAQHWVDGGVLVENW